MTKAGHGNDAKALLPDLADKQEVSFQRCQKCSSHGIAFAKRIQNIHAQINALYPLVYLPT